MIIKNLYTTIIVISINNTRGAAPQKVDTEW